MPCIHEGCTSRNTHGKLIDKIPLYCHLHRKVDHINLNRKWCHTEGCTKIPTYGIKNTKSALFCSSHKNPDHVDVVHKTCLDCNTIPIFGIKGTTEALYCKDHKEDDHVNVKNKMCEYKNCDTEPTYGKQGTTKALFCNEHKEENHINVKDKRCLYTDCNKQPTFGVKGTTKTLYCSTHKGDDHVDVHHKNGSGNKTKPKCLDCDKGPVYGVKGTKKVLYCKDHKHSDHVDIRHTTCNYKDCPSRASFGILYEKVTHCAKHRTPNMYRKNKPKCEHDECKIRPCYTDREDSYPLRCEDHKEDDDVNISQQQCKICLEAMFIKSDTNMCNICSKVDTKRVRHDKELLIKKALEAAEIDFIHDKMSDPGCHKYRPDFTIDCETHIIVVECDEFQHSGYDTNCEFIRMVNIQQGFGGMKTIFIRFNPDGYTNSLGKKIRAGITNLKLNRLISTIETSMAHVPDRILSVINLYYDNDNGTNIVSTIDVDNLFITDTIFIEV